MEPLWGNFGALWVYFGFTLAQVGRSWGHVDPKLAEVGFKCVQVAPKMTSNWTFGFTLWHFASTLGSLWVILETLWSTLGSLGDRFCDTLGDFGATLISFCGHEAYIGIILARFQETLIFPEILRILCNLKDNLGPLWGELGSHFGVTWGI